MRKVAKRAPTTMVWRISEAAPLGEWIDLSVKPRTVAEGRAQADETQGAFVRSSFDLLDGIEMTDDGVPVPAEVFDELFGDKPTNAPARR